MRSLLLNMKIQVLFPLFLGLCFSFTPLAAQKQGEKSSLSAKYQSETLRGTLVQHGQWHPFATAAEREFWNALPENTRRAHIEQGEQALGKEWPALPAALYLEFARIGNRSNYEGPYFVRRNRLADLVLAECIEGQGRFVDQIVNGLWMILEETSWVIPAHIGAQKAGSGLPDPEEPVVDLFSAETVGLLAWTLYLVGPQLDQVSPLICKRILNEAHARVLVPCLERDDFWWMSFTTDHINNWNPWCNSNWLTAALLLEDDAGKRTSAVAKIMRSLDRFIGSYLSDGGCDEGPSYWGVAGASLFDCLELLRSASGGKIDLYSEPLIQNIGRYIYRAHINERYFIDFADAPAKVSIADDLVYRYGKRIGDKNMMALGAYAAHRRMERSPAVSGSLGRKLAALTNLGELAAARGFQPMVRDVWLDGIQVMAARSVEGSPQGLYVAAKGGHNAESHNHNDVGNFIVYFNGQPALIDAGVGTYTRKTFSDQRYEIWTMQSAYHNLPTINGVMQKDGREYAAKDVKYQSGGFFAELSLDISGAYPEAAGVKKWTRTVRLLRGKEVRVVESYSLEKREGDLYLSLMTPCTVNLDKRGQITLKEAADREQPFSLRILYDMDKLEPELEKMVLDDPRLKSAWGDSLTRIVLRAAKNAPLRDTWALRLVQ
ncbi:MAG TPA: heparinase II/III family protein [archaeon]|nr:heparinase II/III family protein [archaeon]